MIINYYQYYFLLITVIYIMKQQRTLDYQGFKPSGGLQNVGSLLVSPARRGPPPKAGDIMMGGPIKHDAASLQAFQ
jgi:hypothetical protein